MTLGERIKLVRNNKGLTQQRLADITGLKRNTIAVYEIDGQIPSERSLTLIARACSINRTWLMTGEGQMEEARTEKEQISDFVVEVLDGNPDDIRFRTLYAMSQFNASDWKTVGAFFRGVAGDKI